MGLKIDVHLSKITIRLIHFSHLFQLLFASIGNVVNTVVYHPKVIHPKVIHLYIEIKKKTSQRKGNDWTISSMETVDLQFALL